MLKCEELCPVHNIEGCCRTCPEKNSCREACSRKDDVGGCPMGHDDGMNLTPVEEKCLPIMQTIKKIVLQKKALEAAEKDMKDKLKEIMEANGVKGFENPILKVTYIAQSTTNTLDSAKVKAKYPEVYQDCIKTSVKSAYVKVEVKEG